MKAQNKRHCPKSQCVASALITMFIKSESNQVIYNLFASHRSDMFCITIISLKMSNIITGNHFYKI